MKGPILAAAAALPLLSLTPATPPDELAPPVRIQAGGTIIDVEVGHAAPTFADLTGDGKKDLLVGQFGGGKLRVYPNVGTVKQPEFKHWYYLMAAGQLAKVPAG